MDEPRRKIKKNACPYCGDADVSHAISFIHECLSLAMGPITSAVTRRFPVFYGTWIDRLPGAFAAPLAFLKIVKFSENIEKAASHRSRVVWEEARRRGIKMQQIIFGRHPPEFYRARINGRWFYFQSLPIPPALNINNERWDDKVLLKRALAAAGIPVPRFTEFSIFLCPSAEELFRQAGKPLVIKPRTGSRGRHTVTEIRTAPTLVGAVRLAGRLSPRLVAEEQLEGDVCRATIVNGILAGFYRAAAPYVIGDGVKTIAKLIEEKNARRPARLEPITLSLEAREHLARQGYAPEETPAAGMEIKLTHRVGRFYGGATKEMIDELHPSFIPILERAAKVLNIAVAGFDCIVPDPTKDAASQRWGIIECNTLPFIDLHYFALEGRPRNIAGAIWDLWKK